MSLWVVVRRRLASVQQSSCLLVLNSRPLQAAIRAESYTGLAQGIDAMDPIDREILMLRHFEELGNDEAAAVLGLRPTAASNRYVRAVMRLKKILNGRTE